MINSTKCLTSVQKGDKYCSISAFMVFNKFFKNTLIGFQSGMTVCMLVPINQLFNDVSIAVKNIF